MQQLLLELAPAPAPTLENFFAGPNEHALAALRDALTRGERVVYLHGAPGSGKTHLLRAAARHTETLGATALYVPAPHADLASRYGERIASNRNSEDGNVLRHNLLAVDDVERLDAASQQALFDVFNVLQSGSSRLLGAGTQPAVDLPLREDLRTRLGSGVSLRLVPLDDEQKHAALSWHATQRGLRLAPEIVAYVLTHCSRDMGTQIAVLDALDRYSLEHKRPVTLPLLRVALKDVER